MDPFFDLYWNLDQIVGWAESRDPEIVRVAALPKYDRPTKSLIILLSHKHTDSRSGCRPRYRGRALDRQRMEAERQQICAAGERPGKRREKRASRLRADF